MLAAVLNCSNLERFFIACTPRTGNTWLRKLLAGNLDLTEYPVHKLDEVPWNDLPPRCIVAMHTHADPELVKYLSERHFRIIVTTRHPLDILISILAYTQFQRKTRRWLAGEDGDESSLLGAAPTDRAFFDYALSARAAVLLGVSVEWLAYAADVVRYESLAAEPHIFLSDMFARLGVAPVGSICNVVAGNSIERLRALHAEHSFHFWRGECGLWRRLLPADVAVPIAERHRTIFEALGYTCDYDPNLSRDRASDNWRSLHASAESAPKRPQLRWQFPFFKR
jgi:hypothetical protein